MSPQVATFHSFDYLCCGKGQTILLPLLSPASFHSFKLFFKKIFNKQQVVTLPPPHTEHLLNLKKKCNDKNQNET